MECTALIQLSTGSKIQTLSSMQNSFTTTSCFKTHTYVHKQTRQNHHFPRLLRLHWIGLSLSPETWLSDSTVGYNSVDCDAGIATSYRPVKWELINRNDDPKMWKQTATAPLVLIPDGPGRVVTVASSATVTRHLLYALKCQWIYCT